MLITRYLFKNLVWAALFVAIALTMIIWLTQSLRFLELIVNADAPLRLFLTLVFLSLPKFLEVILPIALFAAVLFVYSRMISDNELIVMRACGLPPRSLARPAVVIANIFTAILFALTLWLSPACYVEMKNLRSSLETRYSTLLLREGVFNTLTENLTIYLRQRTKQGDLIGILIHDTSDKNHPPVTITARRGVLMAQENPPRVVVYNGLRQQRDLETGELGRLYFDQYAIEITPSRETAGLRVKDVKERNFIELFDHAGVQDDGKNGKTQLLAEAHSRVLMPLLALDFTLIGLALLLGGSFDRRGHSRKIIIAVILAAFLEGLFLGTANLAKQHLVAAALLYPLVLIPMALGFFALSGHGEKLGIFFRRLAGARPSEGLP